MKPKLRRLHSPDLYDLVNGTPADPEDFQILVQAMIGPDDSFGEESFDFLFCTPSVVNSAVLRDKVLIPRHYLIVERYDYQTLWNSIEAICEEISGVAWREVAEKLSRFGKWEFEDYRVG